MSAWDMLGWLLVVLLALVVLFTAAAMVTVVVGKVREAEGWRLRNFHHRVHQLVKYGPLTAERLRELDRELWGGK